MNEEELRGLELPQMLLLPPIRQGGLDLGDLLIEETVLLQEERLTLAGLDPFATKFQEKHEKYAYSGMYFELLPEQFEINNIIKHEYTFEDIEDKKNRSKFETLTHKVSYLKLMGLVDYESSQTKHIIPSSVFQNNSYKSNFFDFYDMTAIQPEELPEMSLAVLDFVEEVQPHIVIGCDRGGRLFSLAMYKTWSETRGDQPFPTLDGKIHFARISKAEDEAVLQDRIDQIVSQAEAMGIHKGVTRAPDEQLRVLFVDDWVVGGGTMLLSQRLMERHGAKTYFAVMSGDGADVTGSPKKNTTVVWHDRPEHIGVNYLDAVKVNTDGSVTETQKPVVVRAPEAVANRQKIAAAAKALGSQVVSDRMQAA